MNRPRAYTKRCSAAHFSPGAGCGSGPPGASLHPRGAAVRYLGQTFIDQPVQAVFLVSVKACPARSCRGAAKSAGATTQQLGRIDLGQALVLPALVSIFKPHQSSLLVPCCPSTSWDTVRTGPIMCAMTGQLTSPCRARARPQSRWCAGARRRNRTVRSCRPSPLANRR